MKIRENILERTKIRSSEVQQLIEKCYAFMISNSFTFQLLDPNRYTSYDNGDSWCCPLIYFRGSDLEILQKGFLGKIYHFRSQFVCALDIRIRAKSSITTNWCLYHAFNCNRNVVCGIGCSFVTCWTESWTHISGLYTCGGNSNNCDGFALASNEREGVGSVLLCGMDVGDCGSHFDPFLCVFPTTNNCLYGSSFLDIIPTLLIVQLCQ
ncbi:unnamed protein product [Trichobilharzia szidati]|nr:unnamed protein product [Trichobilharzia szidati]